MTVTIDSEQHVRIKLGLFWAVLITLLSAAVYTAVTVTTFNSSIDQIQAENVQNRARIDALEGQIDLIRTNNADVATKIAVIETKLSAIDDNTREIRDSLRVR